MARRTARNLCDHSDREHVLREGDREHDLREGDREHDQIEGDRPDHSTFSISNRGIIDDHTRFLTNLEFWTVRNVRNVNYGGSGVCTDRYIGSSRIFVSLSAAFSMFVITALRVRTC
jgi:hypothetical protein